MLTSSADHTTGIGVTVVRYRATDMTDHLNILNCIMIRVTKFCTQSVSLRNRGDRVGSAYSLAIYYLRATMDTSTREVTNDGS
jgi:hypothetical protein